MHVFLPMPDFDLSVGWMHKFDAAVICLSALEVTAVIHETHPFTHELRKHPVVEMWRGYEVSLLDYAFRINERLIKLTPPPSVFNREQVEAQLSYHMDLATNSGFFEMRVPPWVVEKEMICRSHLVWLVSQNPTWYPRETESLGMEALEVVVPLWDNMVSNDGEE